MLVAVTGSSGLIGSEATAALLNRADTVLRLVRRTTVSADEAQWDPERGIIAAERIEGVDALIHLAGENVGEGRWTKTKKARILDSRVRGAALLVETIRNLKSKPEVVIAASAIGIYGDQGYRVLDETSPAGHGFLAETCIAWEAALAPLTDLGVRIVVLRLGVVLSANGGALAKMLTPFRLGLGGVLGSGSQYMSWIALEDVIGAICYCLDHRNLSGVYNVVSPNPVTNRLFTKTLGRVLRMPAILPAPAFALRLALGEMADELLLSSTRVLPSRLLDAGFAFRFAELEDALRACLKR